MGACCRGSGGRATSSKGIKMRAWVTGLLLLGGACLAQAEDAQCERLFTAAEERSTCSTLVGLYPKVPDDELRELVSRQVYGLSAADAHAQRERRENYERAAEKEVAVLAVGDQCSQVFAMALESDVCRWYVGLSPGVRSDDELREVVGAKLLQMKQDEAFRNSVLTAIRNLRQAAVQQRIHEMEVAGREAAEGKRKETEAERYRAEMERLREKYLVEKEEYAVRQQEEREKQEAQEEEEARKRAINARKVAKLNAATKVQRQTLANEYQQFLSRLFSNYNYIKVETKDLGTGFALYGRHSFFSKYTFDVGPQGPTVSQWVSKRAGALRAARIRQVGVRSDSGDWTGYTVP